MTTLATLAGSVSYNNKKNKVVASVTLVVKYDSKMFIEQATGY
jgi:hypothetical protein